MICPACNGAKQGPAFVDRRARNGRMVGSCEMLDCFQCGGKGEVPDLMLIWIANGKKAREERLVRHETLGDCARRLGITVGRLCDAEFGRIDPDTVAGVRNGGLSSCSFRYYRRRIEIVHVNEGNVYYVSHPTSRWGKKKSCCCTKAHWMKVYAPHAPKAGIAVKGTT